MCWGTVDTKDLDDCHCENPLTEHQFEKERFNRTLDKKNESIRNYESEIKRLNKIILKQIKT